jgi:hypothetical protein
MKNFGKILVLAAVALISLWGCSGTTEGLTVTLEADAEVVPADGVSKVKFTVYEGNADVTADAKIIDAATGTAISGAAFSTSAPGEYYFYAEYRSMKSEQVKVVAEEVVVSQFVRNICLMEFTDASCTFCPDASRYIDRNILQKNADVHLIAFHEKDQWKSPQFSTLASMFKLTATPYAVVDMREGYSLETGARDKVKEAITASSKKYSSHCAVAVSSAKDVQGNATVEVKVYSEKSTDYSVAVYVVEDGLIGSQLDNGLEDKDYYHQFVVRKMLSQTVYGDNLGRIPASEEKSKTYTVAVDPDWNLANTYIYALALDANGYVNNMQVCLLDGGSTDYEYKK